MREPCDAFKEAQDIEAHLETCPGREIKVIRAPSGHGGRVCETCRKTNRDEQRKRENAQKRARRAKIKREKMTAGIGAGNVVWVPPKTCLPSVVGTPNTSSSSVMTTPNAWSSSVADSPHTPSSSVVTTPNSCSSSVAGPPTFVDELTLYSPQPRHLNTFNVRSMTQALHCRRNGSISTATLKETNVNYKHERGVEYRSRQLFVATTSNVLQPQENDHDQIPGGIRDDASLHHDFPTSLDFPLYQDVYQDEQCEKVGLGITVADDAKRGPSHTETSWFSNFQKELKGWSTIFEDNNDSDNGEEL